MKKKKMDLSSIESILGLIAIFIAFGIWFVGRLQKKEVEKEKIKTEKRNIIIETGVDKNKNDITFLKSQVERLKNIVEGQRQVKLNYNDLSSEEQEQLLREKFNYSNDELNDLISKAKQRTDSYISNALAYDYENDNINAIKFYNKAFQETTLNSQKAWILFSIGDQYFDLQNEKEAIRYYNMSIDFYDKVNEKSEEDFVILGYVYNGLGMIDRKNANYLKAIENHEKALDIREDLVSINRKKYILELSMSYNNLAVVYKLMGNLDKSIDYNNKAILIRRELASISKRPFDVFLLARTLSNLSNVYSDKGNYIEAKKRIEEAIELILSLEGKIKRVPYEENLSYFHTNYGVILNSLRDYETSIIILKDAIKFYESLIKINRPKYIEPYTGTLTSLARSYRDINRFDESINFFNMAIEIQRESKNKGDSSINLADIYYSLANVYLINKPNKELALKNFKIAYDLYIKYPQSAHAKAWTIETKNRMDYLNGL